MTSIQMPQLGETIIEGTILKWLKREGETIERDEPLFEISTDKVDTEVPSPVAGVVSKILVEEGQTVAVGTELAVVDDGPSAGADSSGDASAGGAAGAGEPARSSASGGTSVSAGPSGGLDTPSAPPAAASPAAASTPAAASSLVSTLPDRGARSQILSPLVRKMAAEHGVDLASVVGTGTGGRITKGDVEGAIATGSPAPAPVAAAGQPVPASVAGVGEEIVPVGHIRKAIAQHMVASLQTGARAWTMVEVNVDRLVKLREQVKGAFFERYGVKLTYLPLVTRATTDALLEFPMVNAELRGDQLVVRKYVNMGIAVSYDQGLIVPVIPHVDAMNVPGIARSIADLAGRARSHSLQPYDVAGATFTITNPGPYGSLLSLPIISQPNSGILSLDAIQKRPVVVDDAIAIRSMVYLSMSWDHRVIDGELATRFLARVKHNLETWDFAEDLGV